MCYLIRVTDYGALFIVYNNHHTATPPQAVEKRMRLVWSTKVDRNRRLATMTPEGLLQLSCNFERGQRAIIGD